MSNGAVLRERNRYGEEIIDMAISRPKQMWTVVDKVLRAEKNERVKSRVSLGHHVADRILNA